MRSESTKRAQVKYEEKLKANGVKTAKTYILKCHKKHDEDIITFLNRLENKNGYLKQLIREDIKKKTNDF